MKYMLIMLSFVIMGCAIANTNNCTTKVVGNDVHNHYLEICK